MLDNEKYYRNSIQRWIHERREWICKITNDLEQIPEPAYKEIKTINYIKNELENIGVDYIQLLDTSVLAYFKHNKKKVTRKIIFVSDIDAVYCPSHPKADTSTGYAHACGHHVQVAQALAIADFWNRHVSSRLYQCQLEILFCPAEEFSSIKTIQTESELVFSGKQELLKRGFFHPQQEVLASHTYPFSKKNVAIVNLRNPGFQLVRVSWKRTNPIKAYFQLVSCIEKIRKSLYGKGIEIYNQDSYQISNHCDTFFLEIYLTYNENETRINAISLMIEEFRKCFSYHEIDGVVKVLGGYQAFEGNKKTNKVFTNILSTYFPNVDTEEMITLFDEGATDLGDVSSIVPVTQVYFSGANGKLHNETFFIRNIEEAVITPIEILLIYIVHRHIGQT